MSEYRTAVRLLLAATAVSVSLVAVWQRVRAMNGGNVDNVPRYVDGWEDGVPLGMPSARAVASDTMLVLADFECPACATYHEVVQRIEQRYGDQLLVLHVDYPLQRHRFSLMAARAAECADQQGRFREMQRVLYDAQDSLGILEWHTLATRAGVHDPAAVAQCAFAGASSSRLEDARRFSAGIAPRGTPTVIVNGWWFPYPPSLEEVAERVRDPGR